MSVQKLKLASVSLWAILSRLIRTLVLNLYWFISKRTYVHKTELLFQLGLHKNVGPTPSGHQLVES